MKELEFSLEFAEDVLDGFKEITLRKYREDAHMFKEGEIVKAVYKDPDDGCVVKHLLVITADTKVCRFDELDDDVAIEDGFADSLDAFEGLGRFYPDLKESDLVGIIRFQIPRINGELIVEREYVE